MGHKKYRICLLMVAIAATVGGVLYYCFSMKEDGMKEKGTLVKQMQQTGEKLKEAGKNVKEDVSYAFSQSGETLKEAASDIREDMDTMASAVREDVKNVTEGDREAWKTDDE